MGPGEYGIAAFITAFAGIIISFINRQGNRSSREHATTFATLEKIDGKLDIVTSTVDRHIGWHDGVDDATEYNNGQR